MRGLRFQIAVLAVSLLIASFGLVVAVVFLFAGLYLYLADWVNPVAAALLTALAGLAFSIIVIGLGRLIASRRREPKLNDPLLYLGALLGKDFENFTEKNLTTSLLVALAAGFVVGVSPRLRKILARFL